MGAGVLEWRAGNWELGARHAADQLALRAQFGHEGEQPIAELPAALIAAHQGRVEEARDRSERALALAEADGIRIAQSGHRWVLGFIELSLGDPAQRSATSNAAGRSATASALSSRAIAWSWRTRWRR